MHLDFIIIKSGESYCFFFYNRSIYSMQYHINFFKGS